MTRFPASRRTPAALLAAVLAMAPLGLHGQAPTFSARREVVRVDALVTRDGRVVRGLSARDFEIVDEGVPQEVEYASLEDLPINVVLVLDTSSSVSGQRLTDLRAASTAVIDGLKSGDRAALFTFDHRVTRRGAMSADFLALREQVAGVAATPVDRSIGTALVDSTFAAMRTVSVDEGRALILVFSDGADTISWLSAPRVLAWARGFYGVVYGVVVRGNEDGFLRDLVQATGGSRIEVRSTAELGGRFAAVLDEFRGRYLLSYSPRGVPATGWHRIQVRTRTRGFDVKARPGYTAGD